MCFVACLPTTDFRLWYPNLAEFHKEVTQMLEDHIGDPTWQHHKVVDKKTGVLAAWASWNTPTDTQIRERDGKAAAKIADSAKGKGKVEFEKYPKFVHYVQDDIDRWFEQSTSGKRHLVCHSLFTDPFFSDRVWEMPWSNMGINWLIKQACRYFYKPHHLLIHYMRSTVLRRSSTWMWI